MSFNRNSFNTEALDSIGKLILSKGETIAVAESVTSGLLQVAFAAVKNASQFYQGGITAYNLGQKAKHLNIEPIHAQNCNCVSGNVAKQMAQNVCSLFHSNWGIGISGYAVPAPESNEEVFAFYSIYHNGECVLSDRIEPEEEDPQKIQLYYVNSMLRDFEELLRNNK